VAEPGESPFLDALSREQADALRALGRRRRHDPGEPLFHEHEPGDSVLILLAGRAKLSSVTESGREALLGIRDPGELIGEMSALDDAPRMATAIALEHVEVLVIPRSAFVAFLDKTPGVAMVLVRMLNRRLRDADRKRIEFLAQDTVGRVCSRLVELAERFGVSGGEGVHIDLVISQEELAGWTGSSREAAIRALRSLRELGWIATSRRSITVLDLAELRRRAMWTS
jgi:CRP-like cAMP-binding protein